MEILHEIAFGASLLGRVAIVEGLLRGVTQWAGIRTEREKPELGGGIAWAGQDRFAVLLDTAAVNVKNDGAAVVTELGHGEQRMRSKAG
jgi:hypothetical protein